MQYPITHVFNVHKFIKTGDTESYDATPLYTGVDACVVPASTDILAVYPGVASYQLFEIHVFENVVLKNGYKLKNDSEEYIIRGEPMKVENIYLSFIKVIGERAL